MLDNRTSFKRIHFVSSRDTAHLPAALYDALAVSTANGVAHGKLIAPPQVLLAESLRLLRPGGLLFIYGCPAELPHWGQHILATAELSVQAIFKYWLALDISEESRGAFLQPNHRGMLMFMKIDPALKKPAKFVLRTKREGLGRQETFVESIWRSIVGRVARSAPAQTARREDS